MMTNYVWHCFCTYCTKKYRCLLHFTWFQHVTQRLVGAQQCWKQDQKYKTKTKTKTKAARPRPQDRGRSETSLAIRPRSQTPRLLLSARNDVMAASLQCDDKSKIRLRQSMSNHAKYNFDPIWNDVALDIFEEVAPTKTTTRTRRRRRVAIKDQFLI